MTKALLFLALLSVAGCSTLDELVRKDAARGHGFTDSRGYKIRKTALEMPPTCPDTYVKSNDCEFWSRKPAPDAELKVIGPYGDEKTYEVRTND